MSTVIYADSLIAVNFSMDFLALFICAGLTKTVFRPIRLAAAALIGALCALGTQIASAYTPLGIAEPITVVLCSYVISFCAFGGSKKAIFKNSVTFFAVNMGLGGLMTALFSMMSAVIGTDGVSSPQSVTDASPAVFAVIALISGAVSIIYGKYRRHSAEQKTADAVITAFGRQLRLTLLSDSGHLLRDPFTGKNVIVIAICEAENWLPKKIIEAARKCDLSILAHGLAEYRLRLIPVESVTGKGLLLGFTPDRLTVDGAQSDAIIAIDTVNRDYNGCGGLVPQELLTQ